MRLRNLFDSHAHFFETGLLADSLDLSVVRGLADFGKLPVDRASSRGRWLTGFGWDENKWPDPERRLPAAKDLDSFFPDRPVYFSRADGHAGVTNSAGLRELGRSGDGFFLEREHFENLAKLPPLTHEEIRRALLAACRRFNEAGFTHVREMGGNPALWKTALELEAEAEEEGAGGRAGSWTVHLDWNFSCENLADFRALLPFAISAREASTELNQVLGIKFYFDGSLGSETAWLSRPYANRADGSCGVRAWEDEDAEALIRETWEAGLDVAVHTIGDAAADRIVDLARKISAGGLVGRLNLEHAQILRPETIQKLKPLHVVCHMQPCHWLSDQRWLATKCGSLARYAFPWEALRRARIPLQFGSDSPIEVPSLPRNLQALRESAAKRIPAFGGDPLAHHVHAGPVIGETLFEGECVAEVIFKGRTVYRG